MFLSRLMFQVIAFDYLQHVPMCTSRIEPVRSACCVSSALPYSVFHEAEWCPDYSATGERHPQELSGKTICRNEKGYWDV